jgi:hypothetical protein
MAIYTSRPLYTEDRAVEIVAYALYRAALREKAYPRAICIISLDDDAVIRVHTAGKVPRNAGIVCYFRYDAACPREALATLMDRCAAECRANREASR